MSLSSSELHGTPSVKEKEYLEGWQRARAEVQNIRKQLVDEGVSQSTRLKANILEDILPVADNFQALLRHVPDNLKNDTWVQGAVHVARDFERVLSDFGLEKIDAMGVQFDPHIHEAIDQVEGGETKDLVVEIVQVGWKVGDKVIRPAKVKVST